MDTIQRQKGILRRELAKAERALTPAEKSASDAAILHHVVNTTVYHRARTVFAFVGRGDEIDTLPLLRRVLTEGKRLCVPLCTAPGIMECREITDLSVLRPVRTAFWSRRRKRPSLHRRISTSLSCPAPAHLPMDGGWAGAAGTTTDFWRGTQAKRCCFAVRPFCGRTSRGRRTTFLSPP